jgi:hypothetical protein
MESTRQKLAEAGLAVPEILLPKKEIDLHKWAVIACDQFTQDRAYWQKTAETAGGAPSTLNLILPEIYLEEKDRPARIEAIHHTMETYLREGIFGPPLRGFMYIERNTPAHKKRRGLLAALDLERYDWKPEARPLIRSTEGTVPERLPVRMDIRRGAPLETPHILLLIDDENDTLLPALGEQAKHTAPVYHTPLMMNAGDVSGWLLDGEAGIAFLAENLSALAGRSLTRYPGGSAPFLYAAGDGNHSLAAAKGAWDEYKAANRHSPGIENHPARWALVEIENLYDPAIEFEPIHRLVFNSSADEILALLSKLPGFSRRTTDRAALLSGGKNHFGIICGDTCTRVETDAPGIATACLQPLLDSLPKVKLDYIHGAEELIRLAAAEASAEAAGPAVGILLPPVNKSGLFETVARSGPLPRKSFSMGEAEEKRFYLECRKLF